MKHELFEILDSVDPKWQTRYKTLAMAVETFGLQTEFEDFLGTPQGIDWYTSVATSTDWVGYNERARAQYEAERALAARAARKQRRYETDLD